MKRSSASLPPPQDFFVSTSLVFFSILILFLGSIYLKLSVLSALHDIFTLYTLGFLDY